MKVRIAVLGAMLVLILSGCGFIQDLFGPSEVLVGWYVAANGNHVAATWKGTVRTDLVDPLADNYDAWAVAVDGGSVYVAGQNRATGRAVYWKDATVQTLPLPAGATNAIASRIVVQNGSVYIAGDYTDALSAPRICYWKDGVRVDLTLPAGAWTGAWDDGIDVNASGSVYVSGGLLNGASSTAWLWKGTTTATQVTHGANQAADTGDGITDVFINNIVVDSGTVYMAGAWKMGGVAQACYWIGSTEHDLLGSDPGKDSWSNAIAVDNGTVYTAGTINNDGTNDAAVTWTGASAATLSTPASGVRSWANAMAEKWDIIYAAGSFNNGGSTFGGSYWAGDTRTDLKAPASATDLQISGIALTW